MCFSIKRFVFSVFYPPSRHLLCFFPSFTSHSAPAEPWTIKPVDPQSLLKARRRVLQRVSRWCDSYATNVTRSSGHYIWPKRTRVYGHAQNYPLSAPSGPFDGVATFTQAFIFFETRRDARANRHNRLWHFPTEGSGVGGGGGRVPSPPTRPWLFTGRTPPLHLTSFFRVTSPRASRQRNRQNMICHRLLHLL